MFRDQPFLPALVLAAFLAVQMGALQVWSLARGERLTYVIPAPRFDYGLDYHDFYQASAALRAGHSPYEIARYVTPPVPAIVNVPLSLLPFRSALWVVLAGVLVAVFGAYALSTASFFERGSEAAGWVLVLGVVTVLLSYPFYFLFERGNIDGFVLALMMLAVWFRQRRWVVAGVCVALAVSFKMYPLLLFAPLFIEGRHRVAAVAALALLVAVLVVPMQWAEFALRTVRRGEMFAWKENGSLVCTFAFLGLGVEALGLSVRQEAWHSAAALVFLALLLVSTYADYLKRDRREPREQTALALLFFPFMVAMPQQADHYSLVVLLALIPAVCHLWRRRREGRARRPLLLITAGLALSQSQAVALSCLVGNIVPHVVPGVGLLLVLAGVTWYKVRC